MRIGVISKAVSLSGIDPRQVCKRKRRSNRQGYRPCDSVGLEAWGLANRDVCKGCELSRLGWDASCLAGEKRQGRHGRDTALGLGMTGMQGRLDRQDRHSAR